MKPCLQYNPYYTASRVSEFFLNQSALGDLSAAEMSLLARDQDTVGVLCDAFRRQRC